MFKSLTVFSPAASSLRALVSKLTYSVFFVLALD